MGTHTTDLTAASFVRRPHPFRRAVSPRAGGVTLTFDDGPHPEYTPAVLDRLREFDLTATFFVIGRKVNAAADVLARCHHAGHAVGNHTATHPRPTWFGFAAAHRELAECQRAVTAITGAAPTLFRPPMGRWSAPLWVAAKRLGLRPIGWSLDSSDWKVRSDADADQCADELLAAVRPGDTLLLHDSHPWIGRLLDRLLPHLCEPALFCGRGL